MELDTPTLIALQLIPIATILLGIIGVYVITKMIGRTEEGLAYEAEETRRQLKLLISLLEPLTAELGPMFRTIIEKNKVRSITIIWLKLYSGKSNLGKQYQAQYQAHVWASVSRLIPSIPTDAKPRHR